MPTLSISDVVTGISVSVAADDRTVIARSENGEILWSLDAIARGGPPAIGRPAIRHLSIDGDTVHVVYGKHNHVHLALRTGRVRSTAAD